MKASPETVLSWYWLLMASDLITESQSSRPFWAVPKTLVLNSFLSSTSTFPLGWAPQVSAPDLVLRVSGLNFGLLPWHQTGILLLWIVIWTYAGYAANYVKYSQVISLLVLFYVCIFQHHFHHNCHYVMLFKLHLPWLSQNILGSGKKGRNGWGIRLL